MADTSGISASLAGRYATALFALAKEKKQLSQVEASLGKVTKALSESDALRMLTTNAAVSRSDAKNAVAAVAKTMKLDALTANTLGVLAENRRLAELGSVANIFGLLAGQERGEIAAHVTSARALTAPQNKALAAKLKSRMGRDVVITSTVDPSILGGLVIKVGSEMIDSSIKTRLNTLATAMKG